ncbi:PEGA domain-containing protein [Candidatus Parcubacteria bacterium]|nr:PEGA domain-containing protein [Candidatus Parcubacteria bacterium]
MIHRYWRSMVFFLFLAGFLLSAPIVVLYTAGYRYHFGAGKIVKTGVLSVSSTPRGADILLNGARTAEKTPAVVSNVLPGAHKVRVAKNGYAPWQKTLDVYSKQTTFAREIVLFLDGEPERTEAKALDAPSQPTRAWQTVPITYTLQHVSDRSVLSLTDENGVAAILAYLPLGSYAFEDAPAPYLLLRDELRGRLILVDSTDTIQPILLNTDAKEWAWSREGDALLVSDGFDIEAYAPSLHRRETITRLSTPITGLVWYPLGRVAVFEHGGNVYAQELDRRGEPNTTTLVQGLEVATFWFSGDGAWILGTLRDGMGFRKRLQR